MNGTRQNLLKYWRLPEGLALVHEIEQHPQHVHKSRGVAHDPNIDVFVCKQPANSDTWNLSNRWASKTKRIGSSNKDSLRPVSERQPGPLGIPDGLGLMEAGE